MPIDPLARRQYRNTRRFETGYRLRPPVTRILVTAFVGIHLLTGLFDRAAGRTDSWGVVFGERSTEVLADAGGRVATLVEQGQLWRLWTCGFLHADALHLFFNATAMWGLGRVCEAVFGSVRTLWVFLLAVIGGSVLSQLGGTPASVGASGGIFGLMGALLVFGRRRRQDMDAELRAAFGRRLWPWVILNLAIGVFFPFIDNLGHVGGLVTGALAALLVDDVVTRDTDSPSHTRRAMALASAVLLLVGLVGVLTNR